VTVLSAGETQAPDLSLRYRSQKGRLAEIVNFLLYLALLLADIIFSGGLGL